MSQLNLSLDELLSTTRAVRKRLDFKRPVEIDVLRECLSLAQQGPTGSNSQGWHFVLVTDPVKRKKIADYYRQAFEVYESSPNAPTSQHADDPSMQETQRKVLSSAAYLAKHLHEVPAFFIPCMAGRPEAMPQSNTIYASMFGSILPGVWSFMLAARARGLGTCWTTLHLNYEKEVAEVLGIPFEQFAQVALIPVAYTLGTDFKAGPRKDLDNIIHIDQW